MPETPIQNLPEYEGTLDTSAHNLKLIGYNADNDDEACQVNIQELVAPLKEANNIEYDHTASGMMATNMKDAIDELHSAIGQQGGNGGSGGGGGNNSNPSAADVSYNSGNSGLNANNVQDAIDEVNGKLSAGNIKVDTANLGGLNLPANNENVQAALEALASQSGGNGGNSGNTPSASQVPFSNTNNGFNATNVQNAIEEVKTAANNVSTDLSNVTNGTNPIDAANIHFENTDGNNSQIFTPPVTNVQEAIKATKAIADSAASAAGTSFNNIDSNQNPIFPQAPANTQEAIEEVKRIADSAASAANISYTPPSNTFLGRLLTPNPGDTTSVKIAIDTLSNASHIEFNSPIQNITLQAPDLPTAIFELLGMSGEESFGDQSAITVQPGCTYTAIEPITNLDVSCSYYENGGSNCALPITIYLPNNQSLPTLNFGQIWRPHLAHSGYAQPAASILIKLYRYHYEVYALT